jgi:hypothetical protein
MIYESSNNKMLPCHATGQGSTMAVAGPGGQAMAKWRSGPSQGRRSGNPGDPRDKGQGTLGTPGQRPWLGIQRNLAMAWPRRRHRAAPAGGMAWQQFIN